jgi:hypothetical protein
MLYFYETNALDNSQEYILMTKKINPYEDWITAHDAALLLSAKLGRLVAPRYIRQLAKSRRQPVRTQPLGYHQLYHRGDILACKVRQKQPTTSHTAITQ